MKKMWLALILGISILTFGGAAQAGGTTEPTIPVEGGGSYDDGSGNCWWCFFVRP